MFLKQRDVGVLFFLCAYMSKNLPQHISPELCLKKKKKKVLVTVFLELKVIQDLGYLISFPAFSFSFILSNLLLLN